jgi:hypothetical protein
MLQVGDVVATKHGGSAIEETVAQGVTGFDKGGPGLRTTDPIDAESPAILKRLECRASGIPEPIVGISSWIESEGEETPADLGDDVPVVPDGDREFTFPCRRRDQRYSASSWSN